MSDARRKLLEQHLITINGLLRGGITRGGRAAGSNDRVGASLSAQWESQRNVLKRVLSEPGDPVDTLNEWRARTEEFRDRYPEREGWTDRKGTEWVVVDVLDAIDKLLEQIEAMEESETFEEYDDEAES
jgi:hypothetical protein